MHVLVLCFFVDLHACSLYVHLHLQDLAYEFLGLQGEDAFIVVNMRIERRPLDH